MKALTMWQPWAMLLALELKEFETRSWSTNYRGPIAIHAAKTRDHLDLIVPGSIFFEALKEAGVEGALPLGAIIAYGELKEVYRVEQFSTLYISEREKAFGDFSVGRFAWNIKIDQVLDEPIPARGYQGLWNWEEA